MSTPDTPTRGKIRDLVKECGLDWHRGFVSLFDGDDTNRYEVLVRAALAAQAEAHAAEVARLTAERDALRAALLAFRQAGIELGWGAHPKWYPLIQQCDAATAARTGSKP